MKKMIVLFLSLIIAHSVVKADNDKLINFDQLPQQSQQFIKKYFAGKSVALVKMEYDFLEKSYEVIFADGNKIEFDRKGMWTDVDCKYTQFPMEIVPVKIVNYVQKNYPDIKINKIEKESRGRYEVELANNIDLKFDAKFNLIDIDN